MNEKETLSAYTMFLNDYRQKINETERYYNMHHCYPPHPMVTKEGLKAAEQMLDLYMDRTTPKVKTDKVDPLKGEPYGT